MQEIRHREVFAVPRRHLYQEFAPKDGLTGRQAMNSFTLGKLAEIHVQGLVAGADESRRARRATSQRLAPRRTHHFHWHKKSVK